MKVEAFRLVVVGRLFGQVLNILDRGSFFGERIFGQEQERTATAILLQDSDFFVVNKISFLKTFKTAIDQRMETKAELIKAICPEVSR